jgi:hypothetical protein
MKRFLLILLAVAAVVALTSVPSHAVDFKFGGMFWTKFYADNNMKDANDDLADDTTGFYTRMRLYFTATASENLMAVCKLELDEIWGDARTGSTSMDGGSDGRGDGDANAVNGGANSGMEVKNVYIQFRPPNSPLTFLVGGFYAKLGSGILWADDSNGIAAMGKFDPVNVTLMYSRVNDNANYLGSGIASVTPATSANSGDNWDLFAANLGFAPTKEFSGNLNGFWLTAGSPDTGATAGFNGDMDLYMLGLDLDYKTNLFSVYFTGAKDFGSMDVPTATGKTSNDFTGWAIMAGGTFNLQPAVLGLDFYYASGDKYDRDENDDIEQFITPGVDGRNTYFMDEVVFPGMFDDESSTINTFPGNGVKTNNVTSTGMTRSNATYDLNNIWAIGVHADFKPLDQTLIQVGGAYMQFVEDVVSKVNDDGSVDTDNKLGTSLYARLTQGVVDGLQLKAAFGYLIADDGYTPEKNEDNAWKFATGLFWSW